MDYCSMAWSSTGGDGNPDGRGADGNGNYGESGDSGAGGDDGLQLGELGLRLSTQSTCGLWGKGVHRNMCTKSICQQMGGGG